MLPQVQAFKAAVAVTRRLPFNTPWVRLLSLGNEVRLNEYRELPIYRRLRDQGKAYVYFIYLTLWMVDGALWRMLFIKSHVP